MYSLHRRYDMEAQEDIGGIFTHPDFLAAVRELLLTKRQALPSEVGEASIETDETDETEVERKVRFLIELRMKKAHRNRSGSSRFV
jgi:hypothetical protein